MLGDGCLEKNGRNVRLRIEHSYKQKDYLIWLYEHFKDFSAKGPRIVLGKQSVVNKIYKKYHYSTNSLKCFNEYSLLFYNKQKKVIPNNISKLLVSNLSLAVWYMDDGYKRNDCRAFRLSTDSFSYLEQLRLINCLKINYNINSKLHKKKNTWNIYIPSKDYNKFSSIISPFIIPSMRYKI